MKLVRAFLFGLSFAGLMPALAGAQAPLLSGTTPEIFRQYSNYVVKIEVVETGSAAKAAIGTGFFASSRGDVVTNYHVISKWIHAPERYRIEMTDASGATTHAAVLGIDVVYDLAVLSAGTKAPGFLTLEARTVEQGTRLYSLGHPRDLGLTIVEGTHNGLLRHTLYPKVHFTGSLNPGMSGGPTLTQGGRVVGVNVSTEGQQISFLVPAARAQALLQTTAKAEPREPKSFLAEVGAQIRANQARYLAGLFRPGTPSVSLGPYELPTRPAEFFRCWADALRRQDLPYMAVTHDCSTDDYIFVSSEQSSGIVRFVHQFFTTRELNPARFFTLYGAQFQGGSAGMPGNEEEVTSFRCQTRNVAAAAGKFRGVLCARQYLKLPGLYDAVFKAAALGSRNAGVVTTLALSGATFENVQAVTRRYMENVQWRR